MILVVCGMVALIGATELHTKENEHLDLRQAHHNDGHNEQYGGDTTDGPHDGLVTKYPVIHDSLTGKTYAVDGKERLDITGLVSRDPETHPVHSPYAKHCIVCYWSGHQYQNDGLNHHETPLNCRVARRQWARAACKGRASGEESHPDCFLPGMNGMLGETGGPMHLDECNYGINGDDSLHPACVASVHEVCGNIQMSEEAAANSLGEMHAPPPPPVHIPTNEITMCHECEFQGHDDARCFREVQHFVEGTCHHGGEHTLCKSFGHCDVGGMDWKAYKGSKRCQGAVKSLCSLKEIVLRSRPPRSIWAEGHENPATFTHPDGPLQHEHAKEGSSRKVGEMADSVEHLLQQGGGAVRRPAPGGSHGEL